MNDWSVRGEEALGLVLYALNSEVFLPALASFLFGPLPFTSGTRGKLRPELGLGLIRQIGIQITGCIKNKMLSLSCPPYLI